MVHQGGEFGPILDILLQYVEQLHQLVWWDLQQKQLFRNTIRSSIKYPQRFNISFYINKLQYPARDAHGLDLGGLAAELIQLVFTKQHFLRYLIIICCWEKHNTKITTKYSEVPFRISTSKYQHWYLPMVVKSTSSRFSSMLSMLAKNLLNVEESISSSWVSLGS